MRMPVSQRQQRSPGEMDSQTERWLSRGCGTHLRVEHLIALAAGGDLYIEGRGGARSFAAALELDGDRPVARRLLITCPLVEPPRAREPLARPPLRPLLERYFEALNDARFADAAACFAPDCLYVHPPYRAGGAQVVYRGRAELAQQWPLRRGSARVETVIERCLQDGNHAFIEGVAAGGSFLSSVVLDADGLISRYVAFYTPQRAPRLADR